MNKKPKPNYWKIAFWIALVLLLLSLSSSGSDMEDYEELVNEYNNLVQECNSSMYEVGDLVTNEYEKALLKFQSENDCYERGTVECYDRGSVNCYKS